MMPLQIEDGAERLARLRSLRALARVICGGRAGQLEAVLAKAEKDPGQLPQIEPLIDRLPSILRRRLLTSWMATWGGSGG
jgi:hypothetical protein